jgi:hypothetical protein
MYCKNKIIYIGVFETLLVTYLFGTLPYSEKEHEFLVDHIQKNDKRKNIVIVVILTNLK